MLQVKELKHLMLRLKKAHKKRRDGELRPLKKYFTKNAETLRSRHKIIQTLYYGNITLSIT